MLDIGDVFRHDDTDDEWVEAIDIRQFDEYGRRIVAYAEPETGEYNGMIAAPPISSPYSKIVEVSTNG